MKIITATLVASLGLTACQYVPGTEANRIDKAEKAVAALMKDPTTVLFTDVRVSEDGHVCGYANGKNSFGAYEGRSGFTVDNKGSEILLERSMDSGNPLIDRTRQCWYEVQHQACMAGENVLNASIAANGPGGKCDFPIGPTR